MLFPLPLGIRKQAAEMEKAIQEGKSSVENIEDFNKQASGWLSSNKAGQVFRGRYTPYTDVKKKILTDVIGKINPNISEQDIPWEMNADGTVNTSKIAAVMTRVSGEAVTAQQLQNAINATLTPTELNQLAISGRYQFRNATPEQLSAVAKNRYESSEKDIDATIAKLEGHATASKSDAAEYNKTLEAIQALKDRKVTLSEQLAKEVKWISENPEEAKAEIYKNGFVNSFSEAFSWEKKKKHIIDNPYQDYKFKVADQRLKEQKFALDKEQFSWKKQMDLAGLDVEKQKLDLQLKKFYGEAGGLETYLGASTVVKDPVIAIQQDRDQYKSSYNDFITSMSKDMGISLSEAQSRINRYQNGDKKAIRVDWRGDADNAVENLVQADRLDVLLKKTADEVMASPEIASKREAFKKAVSNLPAINYVSPSGKNVRMTSEEVSKFVSKYQDVTGSAIIGGGSVAGAPSKGGSVKPDLSQFTDKEKDIYNVLSSPNSNQNVVGAIRGVINRHKPYVDQYRTDMKAYDKLLRSSLLEKTGKYLPKLQAIMVSDKDGAQSRDRLETLANMALSTYTGVAGSQPGGAAELSTDQAASAKEWLVGKDKGNIMYSKLTQGGKKFLVMQKGGQEIVVPLTPQLAVQLPKSDTDMSAAEEDIREVQQHFDGNTNPSNNPTKAYFQPRSFSSLNKLSVTADLQKDRTSALNYLNLNLKLPSGWKNLQLDNVPLDIPNAQTQISKFTDNDILNIYLKSDEVPQAWKDEIIRTYQQQQ